MRVDLVVALRRLLDWRAHVCRVFKHDFTAWHVALWRANEEVRGCLRCDELEYRDAVQR